MAKTKNSTIENRGIIRVPFFNDEFDSLGLHPDYSYYEAVAIIRAKTGCVIGARTRNAGISKSALFKQFTNASEEQKKTITKILGEE